MYTSSQYGIVAMQYSECGCSSEAGARCSVSVPCVALLLVALKGWLLHVSPRTNRPACSLWFTGLIDNEKEPKRECGDDERRATQDDDAERVAFPLLFSLPSSWTQIEPRTWTGALAAPSGLRASALNDCQPVIPQHGCPGRAF